MIKISVRTFVKYLQADEAERAIVLRDERFGPPPPLAQIHYYDPARDTIRRLHRAEITPEEAAAYAASLRKEALRATATARSELDSNADALEHYLADFGRRQLDLLPSRVIALVRNGVEISARPTLCANEDGASRLIFLEFGQDANPESMSLMAQVAYEVVRPVMPSLHISSIEVVAVRRSERVRVKRVASGFGLLLAAACKAISSVLETLEPTDAQSRA
jgi:hypothetical protein